MTGGELAERMMVEPATLSGIVDALQSKGLVERIDRSDDKRRKDIRLTQTGQALLGKIPPPGPNMEAVLLSGLSPQQSATFKTLGNNMLKNLEDELEDGKHAAKDQG
jgi:DNA-binding MarR family transcriptional regulator